MSRIAHKVYFLTDEVRNDFIEMIRRAADFTGVRLISWCIMTNHFHLLVYLPEPEDLNEAEVLRRYGVLKGKVRLAALEKELASLRCKKNSEAEVQKRLDEIKRPMYDIGKFMKIIKQWMTQEYNRRYSHTGTLWEAVYRDVPVAGSPDELGKRAGYIHLNPIRAAMTDDFAGYPWSSFTALRRGDEVALSGMRLIYGPAAERDEIFEAHHELMSTLLEQMKLEKAQDVARRRLAGFDVPIDPLTTEALVAQEAEHIKRVQDESVKEKTVRRVKGRPAKATNLEMEIRKFLALNPNLNADAIVEATGCSRTAVYRYLRRIRPRYASKSQKSRK